MHTKKIISILQPYIKTCNPSDDSTENGLAFFSNIDSSATYVFYGIGNVAKQIMLHLKLKKSDFPNLIFCDKTGDTIKTFMDFPVIVPEVLVKDYKNTPIVLTLLDYKEEVCQFLLQNDIKKENIKTPITEEMMVFLSRTQKITPQTEQLSYFVLNILDHCNLKCQCCDHFACIAEERFVSIADIEKDLAQMSKILSGNVARIGVMGGEPLLHPQLLTIVEKTRQYFPKTSIQIVTNAILLMKQPQAFWDCCKKYNIELMATKYPLTLPYDTMLATAKKNGVLMDFYSSSGVIEKTSYKAPLDLSGNQNAASSFLHCFHANTLPLLMEGKFYACTVAPNVHHFNQKFNQNLPIESGDFLDIHTITDKEEIFTFLSTPTPFCKYCITEKRFRGFPWATTKSVIEEWLP